MYDITMQSKLRKWLSDYNIHPRRWINSFFTYRKYMGYIRPHLIKNVEDEYHVRRKIFDRSWEPQALTIPVGKKIVLIAPHADDESIGAGGFLWAHRNISELHIVLLTQGDKGGNLDGCSSENKDYRMQLAQKRHNEFMRTAEMIGAVTYHFNYAEEEIPCTIEAAQRIREVMQKVKPDLVLIPWLFDNLPDHRRANILYAWGCADLELMVLAYEIWTMLDANAILDITDYIDGKMSMIKNYESQLQYCRLFELCCCIVKSESFSISCA